ncbi:MAG TPA: universal stress protein [Hanamia sp.]|nr:universal stress protein [Hanamia sp.]
MKTLLIPVDFTPASENAIDFAVEGSRKYLYERIILLKSFYTSMYENVIMAGEFANVDQHYLNRIREKEKERLDILCKNCKEKAGDGIMIQSFVSEMPLVRSILQIIKSEKPEMVLLGSDNLNNFNAALVSGNVISIAKSSPVRVLIVPKNYKYKVVKEALAPCDFNFIDNLDKINSLRSSPRWHDVKLLVLNVNSNESHNKPAEKHTKEENNLHDYLKNFQHEIYYTRAKNVINGILNFEKIKNVQLIIAMPERYSFLYSLTHKSISEALYRNTVLPVMILK